MASYPIPKPLFDTLYFVLADSKKTQSIFSQVDFELSLDYLKKYGANKASFELSQKSIREIFTVLSSFYNYLLIDEKISINPISLIKQKSKYLQKRQQQSSVMRLTEKQWQTCLQIVREMADKNPEKHERTLFIL